MSGKEGRVRGAEAEEEDSRQYRNLEAEEAARKPKNHGRTLFFADLCRDLFKPLSDRRKTAGAGPPGRGRQRAGKLSPAEQRRQVIARFMARWRDEVGEDIYPALRLIIPTADRDRGVYNVKESGIGKLLVKVLKIDRNSADGFNLLHWKSGATKMAGDFAGVCFEAISKRPMLRQAGDMRIADVNEQLDRLVGASGEKEQLPILELFYHRMNAEEMMWLMRILLKQIKVGSTEKTFFDVWHPDAEALFSVSSSLRRVCWDLTDPSVRLGSEETEVSLMQCFQPQLAQFQLGGSFPKMVQKLLHSSGDDEFWMEEKLDGERMQLHMIEDDMGKRFAYWSRKGKNYTDLYGARFDDQVSALTHTLRPAFHESVRNIILDGEMVTWDPVADKIMAFGTLKSAVRSEHVNRFTDPNGPRPFFQVFDILLLNDKSLSKYSLRDRRAALEASVKGVPRRLEVHKYTATRSPDDIEPALRKIVAESSEGLVLKNPGSMYRLNSRNDDWIKVKPEYMDDLGESVDVVIIGGYYGSGHRGGTIASYLCGLRASKDDIRAGAKPEKCFSFCKVGGGFRAEDFATLRHETEGKWSKWDSQKPPWDYIELGGGREKQYETPDVWIRPSQSVVISVKAASITSSIQFGKGITLRFPRFKAFRADKSWDSAMTVDELRTLKERIESKEKAMTMEKRRHVSKRVKKELVIAGQDSTTPVFLHQPKTKLFEGLLFCVLSACAAPKRSKTELEAIIKENGGKIIQRVEPGVIPIAEKAVVKVASLLKAGDVDVIRPKWILDCIGQGDFLLPYEPGHLFRATAPTAEAAEENVDPFGDSYARDLTLAELRTLLRDMPKKEAGETPFDKDAFLSQLEQHACDLGSLTSRLFTRLTVYFAGQPASPTTPLRLGNWVRFGRGRVVDDLDHPAITHVVILDGGGGSGSGDADTDANEVAARTRSAVSSRTRPPYVVSQRWLHDCWTEKTLLAEERYVPGRPGPTTAGRP